MSKQIVSMNIDKEVYKRFSSICKDKGIIMSKLVENFMKDKLKEKW